MGFGAVFGFGAHMENVAETRALSGVPAPPGERAGGVRPRRGRRGSGRLRLGFARRIC